MPTTTTSLDHNGTYYLTTSDLDIFISGEYNNCITQPTKCTTDSITGLTQTTTCAVKPCLQPHTKSVHNCGAPKCEACQYGKAQHRPTKTRLNTPHPDAQHLHPQNVDPHLVEPGNLVSVDYYESTVRGCLCHTKGCESPHHRFVGGTLFYDHVSHAIFAYHQVSLGSSDTINSKNDFEATAARCGRTIKQYHTDNSVFASQAFPQALQTKDMHTKSGTGAHDLNGGAERAIGTVTSMARASTGWRHTACPCGPWPLTTQCGYTTTAPTRKVN